LNIIKEPPAYCKSLKVPESAACFFLHPGKEDTGRGNPAPTLTFKAYEAFGTIRGLFVFVKVEGSGEVPSPANDEH